MDSLAILLDDADWSLDPEVGEIEAEENLHGEETDRVRLQANQ